MNKMLSVITLCGVFIGHKIHSDSVAAMPSKSNAQTSAQTQAKAQAAAKAYLPMFNMIISQDDVESLQKFIAQHPDFDWAQIYYNLPWPAEAQTPFSSAVFAGAVNCVAYLLVNQPTNLQKSFLMKSTHGFTPLYYAHHPAPTIRKEGGALLRFVPEYLYQQMKLMLYDYIISDTELVTPAPTKGTFAYDVAVLLPELRTMLQTDDVAALQKFVTANPSFSLSYNYGNALALGLTNNYNPTPLMMAAWYGAVGCAQYLLKNHGSRITIFTQDAYRHDVLWYLQHSPVVKAKSPQFNALQKLLTSI